MDFSPGTIIEGKYRIVRLLGQGGMGAVYEGAHTRTLKRVAIKVLHTSLRGKDTLIKRFEQEATAAARIRSEHIVDVSDIGSLPSGELFMVMELLEGEDLGTRIKKFKRLKPHDAAAIVHQLLEGLTAAHNAGIIHRDLKPENVFLVSSLAGRRDFVKILDFGVSKFSALDGESMSMTSTGAVVGTPYYLSPEQARGLKNIDARSDLYSVGVVLYQSVTGRLPFNAETFNELVFKIALEEPEPAETVVPNLDRSFAAIVSRAMVRDVNGRFQTARDFQEALEQWMAGNASPGAARTSAVPQGPPAGRSGTMAMEQVVEAPANWQGAPMAAPQQGHGSGYYQAGAGAPAVSPGAAPYATPFPSAPPGFDPHAGQAGMRSGSYAPPVAAQGGPGYGAAAAQGGYAPPGGYAGTPMPTPQPGAPGAPMMMTSQLGAPGAPMMMTPQPGALQVPIEAAAPPKKRGLAVAAAVVFALAVGGGALGAYMLFGRGDAQGGSASTTPQTPATTAEAPPPAPPTAMPSQAPSADATAANTGTEPTATAPSSTASAPSATVATSPTGPLPPATNTAGTAINPKGPFTTPGPSKTATTATTATATPPPKPTGRVIGSDL